MVDEHPNLRLFERLDLRDLDSAKDVLSEGFVWHYVNPRLPELEGDHVGLPAFGSFFERLHRLTEGTFRVTPVSITPCGDELVVTHTRNSMRLDGQDIEVDAVVVWRVVGGRLVEAWDIPAVH